MNSLIGIVMTTLLFALAGWYWSHLLPKLRLVERLGLSFLLGTGLTTYLWFTLARLHLPLNIPTLLLTTLTVALVGYLVSRLLHLELEPQKADAYTKRELVMRNILIVSLALAFMIGSYNPLTAWDSLALYDFAGHAVALDHSLRFMTTSPYYLSYPLLVSLAHASVYLFGGISAQGIHSVFFVAFIAVIYGRLRDWTTPFYALLGCLLVVGQNELFSHATFAYTNLPYTTYLIAALLYALSSAPRSLIVSGLILALSTWVRSSEVFWIIGLILIGVQGIRTKQWWPIIFSAMIVLGLRYSWSSFMTASLQALNFVPYSVAAQLNIESVHKIIKDFSSIYWYIYLNIIFPYHGVWFLVVPSFIISLIKRSWRLFLFSASILTALAMVVVGVMIFSTYYTTWSQIGDSARRMMLFIIPLSLIMATYALYLVDNKGKHAK